MLLSWWNSTWICLIWMWIILSDFITVESKVPLGTTCVPLRKKNANYWQCYSHFNAAVKLHNFLKKFLKLIKQSFIFRNIPWKNLLFLVFDSDIIIQYQYKHFRYYISQMRYSYDKNVVFTYKYLCFNNGAHKLPMALLHWA